MTSIHRIPVEHVEIGMFVSETTPGLSDTGLNSRGLISRADTLTKLRQSSVREIHIDTSRGKGSLYSSPVAVWDTPIKPSVELEKERERAAAVYSEARSLVGNLVNDVKLGRPVDIGPIEGLAEDISESVLANANALMCLSQIREKDQYLLEHSINVGILMGVFTRYLGYQREELHQIVTGAILHDIGKIRVPSAILNKSGRLTEEEWALMQKHVEFGEDVLVKSPGISDIALSICAQHHEKLSGKGYPRGLAGKEISTYGRLASIVDIYDAITADRVYHKGKSPFETMRILASLGAEDLDKQLVYQFIRCMGVYPVGTFVELESGRGAVVIQANLKKPEAPLVRVMYNVRHKHFEASKVLDLNDSRYAQKIVRALDPRDFNISLHEFL